MTNNILNKLVINETIKCESYTQKAVAAYVVFLKINGADAVKDLKLDLLTVCDGLIIPEGVNADEEERLAKLIKMEVLRLENGRLVRPPSG